MVDPRRAGSLAGVVGGLVFVFSYAPSLGSVVTVAAGTTAITLALAVLWGHYVRRATLGPLHQPPRAALGVYLGCVAAELAAIAVGSRVLTELDRTALRPALIAAVVGLHFLPFAWAFGEPMFRSLGSTLFLLGCGGLVIGAVGVPHAADSAAVLSGLVMLSFVALYARGRFARSVATAPTPV